MPWLEEIILDIGEFDSIHPNGIGNEALINGLQEFGASHIKNMRVQLKAKDNAMFTYINSLKSFDNEKI